MKESILEKKKSLKNFFVDYGKVTFLVLTILVCVVTCTYLFNHVKENTLRISFLDIGQGDSILIQTPGGHDMLIDGGGSDKVLEKIGEKMGYFDHHIDVIVATHPDADHITGLIPILEKYDVDTIITSPISGHSKIAEVLGKEISNEHAQVHIAKKGDEIIFGDGVVAYVLYPTKDLKIKDNETNDASVSMVITYGDESVLLTGDLPSTREGDLLTSMLSLWPSASVKCELVKSCTDSHHITIYKAGHHGSKFSSGEQLLSYIKPEYVVISAGKDNKYGHPNPEAVSRLETYSKQILSTIDKGTITFLLDGKIAEIITDK
jgi:competence protein ComEC